MPRREAAKGCSSTLVNLTQSALTSQLPIPIVSAPKQAQTLVQAAVSTEVPRDAVLDKTCSLLQAVDTSFLWVFAPFVQGQSV